MTTQHLRTILPVAAFALGCAVTTWLSHSRPVQAAATPDPVGLSYQFQNIGPQSSLTIYNPADHILTVYQGATTGNDHLSCTYQYRIARPGASIERRNCQPGSLLP